MSIIVSRQGDLRKNQKERTRAAIVKAAVELLRGGETPTVLSAAEAAKVSRATAYRYFPTQDSLLSDVMAITPSLEPVEAALKSMTSQEPQERLEPLLGLFNRIVVENESQYRAALRVYLDTWFENRRGESGSVPRVRAGRRMRWLEETLKPLRGRLPAPLMRRLKNALALTMGIDSVVIMKDVCSLEDDEALEVLKWAARLILEGAISEAVHRRPRSQGS
jgi:AcrR family transcriptional regulator